MKTKYPRLERMKLAKLARHPDNPRTITEDGLASLRRSRETFGTLVPIVYNVRTRKLLGGHQNLKVLSEMGHTETDVWCVDVAPKMEQLAMLQLNSHAGDWDKDALSRLLAGMKQAGADLALTGLDKSLMEKLASLNTPVPTDNTPTVDRKSLASLDDLKPSAEEAAAFKGRKIIVQFSGGKDSSTTALWCRRFFPDNETELCYVDLGSEHVTITQHLFEFACFIGAKLLILRSKVSLVEEMLRRGKWPHFGGPYCQTMLYDCVNDYTLTHDAGKVVVIRGGRVDESAKETGFKDRWYPLPAQLSAYRCFQPVYFAPKPLCERILSESKAPVWCGYASGLGRTACRCCPGQNTGTYLALRNNHPEVWAELMWLESKLGPFAWQKSKPNGEHYSFGEMADCAAKRNDKGAPAS